MRGGFGPEQSGLFIICLISIHNTNIHCIYTLCVVLLYKHVGGPMSILRESGKIEIEIKDYRGGIESSSFGGEYFVWCRKGI